MLTWSLLPSLPPLLPRPRQKLTEGPEGFVLVASQELVGPLPPRGQGPPSRLPSLIGSRVTAVWSNPAATTIAWMRTLRGETTT